MQPITQTDETAATSWFFEQVAATALDAGGGGEAALVERAARGGSMPPLHARDGEAETYRVLDGLVTFFVGDEAVSAGPGDVVVAPAGVPRTFRVESAEARWLVLTRVRSLSLFEDFGRATAAPALGGAWPSIDELTTLAAIAAANDIVVLGPPGALP